MTVYSPAHRANADSSARRGYDRKFLEAVGFGKAEEKWITEYDTWPVRGGFLNPYMMVGRDPPTSSFCGKHRYYSKCDLSDLHASVGGGDVYHNTVTNCHLYRCSLCWKYGWCVNGAHRIESRFLTAEKVLGLPVSSVEHFSVSAPESCYDMPDGWRAKLAFSAFERSGGVGAVSVFHPFRKDRVKRDLFLGFHYHFLGYLDPVRFPEGYDRCRSCNKTMGACWDCDGFEGVARRSTKKDGWVVSLAKNENGVVEKRESVFGTAWYQLEHSGFRVGVPRFSIVEWWGNVAKRRFKSEVARLVCNCGVCKSPMKRSNLPFDVAPFPANRGEKGFLKNFTLPHVDDFDELDRG